MELEREQEDPARGRAPPPPRAAARAARAHGRLLRALPVGVRGGRARARVPGERGLGEEILREFRVGYAPERLGPGAAGLAQGSGSPSRSCTRRAWRSAPSRTASPMTASARGSCSRSRTSAGGCSASARGRCARSQRPKYLNTSDNDVYHKGPHLYGAHLARPHAARRGRGDPVRGLHRHDRPAPGGHAQRGGADGHGPDRRAGRRAGADGPDGAARAGRRQRRARRRCCARPRLAAKRKLELRVVELPGGRRPGRADPARGPEAMSAAVEGVGAVRALPRRAGARRRRPLEPRGPRPHARGAAPGVRHAAAERDADGAHEARLRSAGAAREPRRDSCSSSGAAAAAGGAGERRAAGAGAASRRRGSAARGSPAAGGGLSRREETERAFLALCIASPQEGARRSRASTSTSTSPASCCGGRPGTCARADLREPMASPPARAAGWTRTRELKELLAELIVQAGPRAARPGDARGAAPAAGAGARGPQDPAGARTAATATSSALAQRRAEVKREFDQANERVLEETGDRAG